MTTASRLTGFASSALLTSQLLLAGCAIPPTNNFALDQSSARIAQVHRNFETLRNDPNLQTVATSDVNAAATEVAAMDAAYAADANPKKLDRLAASADARIDAARATATVNTVGANSGRPGEPHSTVEEIAPLQPPLVATRPAQASDAVRHAVLFDEGVKGLGPDGLRRLARVAAALRQHPQRTVLLNGFSDSRGSDAANMALSEQRADSVRRSLVDLGVADDRISAQGYGEASPVADNATSAGRRLNRRVEIVMSGDLHADAPF